MSLVFTDFCVRRALALGECQEQLQYGSVGLLSLLSIVGWCLSIPPLLQSQGLKKGDTHMLSVPKLPLFYGIHHEKGVPGRHFPARTHLISKRL